MSSGVSDRFNGLLRATQLGMGSAGIHTRVSLVLDMASSLTLNCFGWRAITRVSLVLCAGTPTWRWILVRNDLGVNKPTNELHKVSLMEIPMCLPSLLLGELQPPTVFASDCHCPLK